MRQRCSNPKRSFTSTFHFCCCWRIRFFRIPNFTRFTHTHSRAHHTTHELPAHHKSHPDSPERDLQLHSSLSISHRPRRWQSLFLPLFPPPPADMPRGSQTLRRKHTRSAPPAATHHRRQSKDAGSVLSTRSRFSLPVTSPSSSSPTLRASASVTTTASANQTKIFNRALRLQRGTAVRQRELVYEDTAEEERVDAAKAKNRCSKTKGGSTGSIVFDAAKAKNRSKTKSDTSTSSIVWTCEVVHDAAAPPPSSPPPQPRFNNQTQNSVKVLKSRTSPSLARHPPPPPAGKAPLDPELMDFPPRRPPQVIHHFHSAPNEPRDTMPSIAEAYKEEGGSAKRQSAANINSVKNSVGSSPRGLHCLTTFSNNLPRSPLLWPSRCRRRH